MLGKRGVTAPLLSHSRVCLVRELEGEERGGEEF